MSKNVIHLATIQMDDEYSFVKCERHMGYIKEYTSHDSSKVTCKHCQRSKLYKLKESRNNLYSRVDYYAQNMIENNFYERMSIENSNFKQIHENWYVCFSYMLRQLCNDYNQKVIESLFYDFQMDNWKALYKENSVDYKGHTKTQLIKAFFSGCHYISDRYSYDRIFRTHWLFRQAFDKELSKLIIY